MTKKWGIGWRQTNPYKFPFNIEGLDQRIIDHFSIEEIKLLIEIVRGRQDFDWQDMLLGKETRPWGTYEVLLDTEYCKVKRIIVKPNSRLSYQYHNKLTLFCLRII